MSLESELYTSFSELMLANVALRLRAVHAGLSPDLVGQAAQYARVSRDRLLKSLDLSSSTIGRRERQKLPLTVAESEKLDRLAQVLKRAEEIFADPDEARAWMTDPVRSLGGQAPLDLLDTQVGYEMVMDVLGQISYGAVA